MAIVVLLVACVLALGSLQVISSENIVLNEDKLIGTCTGTCNDIPTLYGAHNCKKISQCRLNSVGWNRGFVRCDYCVCNCEKETGEKKDVFIEKTNIMLNEWDIFGTCTSTCNRNGVVRTNFHNCQKMENCRTNKNGYTYWFHRCDYCTCSCVNSRVADKYTLENVKYDMSGVATQIGKPTAVAQTILENNSGSKQAVTRVLTFSDSSSSSMTTSHSIETGLELSVKGTAGLPGIGKVESEIKTTLVHGFTTEAGKETTTTKEDQIQASITVPPHASITAMVIGHRMIVNIQYTADLVTTYKDGSKKTKPTHGLFTNVQTGQFRVQYSASKPIGK